MATITGLTAARMLEIENESIVDGEIDSNGHLILTRYDGITIDAGLVTGDTGPSGPQGIPGVAGVSSIPGEIKAWPNTVLPIQGSYGKWVWADGAVYVSATYPVAASHIHANWRTAYGQSDPGAGNFRVPDLRGMTLAGLDQMPGGARANRMTRSVALTIAAKTGEETHIVIVNEMPAHVHAVGAGSHTHNVPIEWDYGTGNGNSIVASRGTGNVQAQIPTSGASGVIIESTGGGSAHENVQPTVFVPYIIRLDG